jgi:hypothetical protein
MELLILAVIVFCFVQVHHFGRLTPADYSGVPTEVVQKWLSAERTSYACLLATIICLTVAYYLHFASQPPVGATTLPADPRAFSTQTIIAAAFGVVMLTVSAARATQASVIRRYFGLTWSPRNFVPRTPAKKEDASPPSQD